uniref:Uncharacterized protein n=1 Tax=Cucumis melo TaxID=3656 RepID=A0A9I9E1N6_CUCME
MTYRDAVESKFVFEAKFIQVDKRAIVQSLRMSSHQDTTSFNYLDLVTTDGRLIIVLG